MEHDEKAILSKQRSLAYVVEKCEEDGEVEAVAEQTPTCSRYSSVQQESTRDHVGELESIGTEKNASKDIGSEHEDAAKSLPAFIYLEGSHTSCTETDDVSGGTDQLIDIESFIMHPNVVKNDAMCILPSKNADRTAADCIKPTVTRIPTIIKTIKERNIPTGTITRTNQDNVKEYIKKTAKTSRIEHSIPVLENSTNYSKSSGDKDNTSKVIQEETKEVATYKTANSSSSLESHNLTAKDCMKALQNPIVSSDEDVVICAKVSSPPDCVFKHAIRAPANQCSPADYQAVEIGAVDEIPPSTMRRLCLALQHDTDFIFCMCFLVSFLVSASFLTTYFYRKFSASPG